MKEKEFGLVFKMIDKNERIILITLSFCIGVMIGYLITML